MTLAQATSVERALWTAMRALEERAALTRKLAGNARERGHQTVATMFEDRSRQVDRDIEAIHPLILGKGSLEPVGQDGI